MIRGMETCKDFRQSWMELVPLILAAAMKSEAKEKVEKLLKQPRFRDLKKSYGECY